MLFFLLHYAIILTNDLHKYNNQEARALKLHETHESAEDYLETILILSKRLPVVRSVDIAKELEFSKPSVSVAMKKLRQEDFIEISESGFITLTKSGLALAEKIYSRHKFLSDWLVSLGVEPKTASADACRMEHIISEDSLNAIKNSINK